MDSPLIIDSMDKDAVTVTSPKLYTMDEAAQMLRVSRTLVYRMSKRGQLRVVKFGRRTLVEASEIDRVIREASAA